MVQKISSIWAPVLALRISPPNRSALLSEIVLLISLSVPPLVIPPPVSARFPETVLLMSVYGPSIDFLGQLAIALVLVVGGLRVIDGATSVGTLAAFILYVRQFFDPLQDLSQFYNVFQAAGAALEKLAGVLEETPTVREPSSPAVLTQIRECGTVASKNQSLDRIQRDHRHLRTHNTSRKKIAMNNRSLEKQTPSRFPIRLAAVTGLAAAAPSC